MSDEIDLEDWEAIQLADGDVYVFHAPELLELVDALAVMAREGALFVLRRDTLKWVNVETLKPKVAAKVREIRGSTDGAK